MKVGDWVTLNDKNYINHDKPHKVTRYLPNAGLFEVKCPERELYLKLPADELSTVNVQLSMLDLVSEVSV